MLKLHLAAIFKLQVAFKKFSSFNFKKVANSKNKKSSHLEWVSLVIKSVLGVAQVRTARRSLSQ